MNECEDTIKDCLLRITKNEENLETLRNEQKRLENLEDDIEAAHRRLMKTLYDSSGWRGNRAKSYNNRMENDLLDNYEFAKKELSNANENLEKSSRAILRENEMLHDEVSRLERKTETWE